MARGGARAGSGRKPKSAQGLTAPAPAAPTRFTPTVMDGGRAAESKPESNGLSAIPPEDLPADQRGFWHRYAALAIDQGTLTRDTEPAFRLLCELEAEKAATKQTIDRDGRTYIKCTVDGSGQEHQELKAHPLTGSYRQLAQRIEALMARYMLAPFGKPPTQTRRRTTPAANPWAGVAAKR